jgi:hypothetical protein
MVSGLWETITVARPCGSPVLNLAARPHNDVYKDGRPATEETYGEVDFAQNYRQK